MATAIREVQWGIELRVKVVPGASRDRIAGMLGDDLKILVAAPPEAGKANESVRRLLATTLGVAVSAVEIKSGHGQPRKVVLVLGITPETALSRLGLIQ